MKVNILKHFTIFSDFDLPEYDSSVRMYWNGESWDQDTESSPLVTDKKAAKEMARDAKCKFPKVDVSILGIYSETMMEIMPLEIVK